jgi:DNA-binding MarR family transcriptional regulator
MTAYFVRMDGNPRLTKATIALLDVLVEADPGEPLWGLLICRRADLGPGTVYPGLERLAERGWVTSSWEDVQPAGRPRRRFYTLTVLGRREYAAALAARERRRPWSSLVPMPAAGGAC